MSDTTLTNRQIAARAGWSVTPVRDKYAINGEVHYYAIVDPDGKQHTFETAYSNINEWPHWAIDDELPDYLHSVDAALTLPLDEEHFWMLWGDQDWWEATVTGPTYSDDRLTVRAATAAEAVCRAWWAFKNSEQEG